MSISEPFIRRPIATSLMMLGVLVFGIGAYGLLPVAALPKGDFPTIVVAVNYPGASPDTMASAIATPLEQQFAGTDLREFRSASAVPRRRLCTFGHQDLVQRAAAASSRSRASIQLVPFSVSSRFQNGALVFR